MSRQVLSPQEKSGVPPQAWIRFLRAHAAITRELSARLESEHGLTLSDYDVLVQLYHAPERRMRRVDIARSVLLTASGITRLLDGLERSGLVCKQRCEEDARVTWAVLTDEGVGRYESAQAMHLADVEELFGANFDAKERAQLEELLGRLPLAPVPAACEGEES